MDIFVIDISGKVTNYDIALCEALTNDADRNVEFLCPLYNERPACRVKRLVNLVPQKYKSIEHLWKRVLKLLELTINYIIVTVLIAVKRPDIVHIQWFPLLEFSSVEIHIIRFFKIFSPKTRVIWTLHNLHPHEASESKKAMYAKRVRSMSRLIDAFIVHTEKTKKDINDYYDIDLNKISVVHHGIFVPQDFIPSPNSFSKSICFIIYGNLSHYKGLDIFVDAFKCLPDSYKQRIHGVIAGGIIDKNLCKRLQDESVNLNIEWHPYFLPERELYERINNSNVIVLPYRRISQSGVLLLALYFRRCILTSDLPSFKETLHGFTDDMFFESENPQSLAQLMMRYADGEIDIQKQYHVIEQLNIQYSWEKAAQKTMKVYNASLASGVSHE